MNPWQEVHDGKRMAVVPIEGAGVEYRCLDCDWARRWYFVLDGISTHSIGYYLHLPIRTGVADSEESRMTKPYRDMSKDDEEHAAEWFRDNGIEQPLCWGKDQTCENKGNWLLPDREGIYCAECRNVIRGN